MGKEQRTALKLFQQLVFCMYGTSFRRKTEEDLLRREMRSLANVTPYNAASGAQPGFEVGGPAVGSPGRTPPAPGARRGASGSPLHHRKWYQLPGDSYGVWVGRDPQGQEVVALASPHRGGGDGNHGLSHSAVVLASSSPLSCDITCQASG